MAVLDLDDRRLLVRIVYDGPASAGKTTNLQQLAQMFTPQRRGELLLHGEKAGRTLYFDWLQVEGGLVAGYPLRCQLVTVPGQAVLGHRRRAILAEADVVVFVCDSTEVELPQRMLEAWRELPSLPPLLLQANKQDRAGALAPNAIRHALGLGDAVPAVPAVAADGVGVKETLVLAMRAAADAVQRAIQERGVGALVGRTLTDRDLWARLERIEASQEPTMARASVVLASIVPTAPAAATATTAGGSEPAVPAWPLPGVSSVMVWPAVLGRAVIEELAPHAHAVGQLAGAPTRFGATAARMQLATSPDGRFASLDEARGVMLERARWYTRLAALLPERLVLNLQRDSAGGYWLWEIWPRLLPLETWLERASAEGDQGFFEAAAVSWSEGVRAILRSALVPGLMPDPDPASLAVSSGRVIWLGQLVGREDWVPRLVSALGRWWHRLSPGGRAALRVELELSTEALTEPERGLLGGFFGSGATPATPVAPIASSSAEAREWT